MIGKSEDRLLRAALKNGREVRISLQVRGWDVEIYTAPASRVWKQDWIARVHAVKPYSESSQWCRSVEEIKDALRWL